MINSESISRSSLKLLSISIGRVQSWFKGSSSPLKQHYISKFFYKVYSSFSQMKNYCTFVSLLYPIKKIISAPSIYRRFFLFPLIFIRLFLSLLLFSSPLCAE